ncbi:MAG: hypothetical protein IPN45_08230 [Actinomycetales bacterium]|nr:hypothetical protein [Actinomycetales bacterium]
MISLGAASRPTRCRPNSTTRGGVRIGQKITLADSRYVGYDGPALRRAAVIFREQDTAHRRLSRALVRASNTCAPRGRRIAEHQRQVDLLRAQLGAGRGRLRFADLFRETESVLTGILPCIAMSPYAVAHSPPRHL